MKAKIKSLDITEKEYRDLPNVSYSFLSALDRLGPAKALKEVEPTEPMIFGTMVDSMMDGTFDNNDYYITSHVDIGEKIKPAIDKLVEIVSNRTEYSHNLSDYLTDMTEILKNYHIDYYLKRTPESRATSILKDKGAVSYFKNSLLGMGKTIISFEMYNDAKECKNILLSNEFTKSIFDDNVPGVDAFYQFKYKWNSKGLQFKGMLDRLLIDHNNKLIKPYDLKTGGKSVLDFEQSFFGYRYDIQALLYKAICMHIRDEHYPDYKVDNFRFVYIGRYEKSPLIWEVTNELLSYAAYGYVRKGKKVKGVKELVKDYKWYLANSFNVSFPEEVYNNNGVVDIPIHGIKSLKDD